MAAALTADRICGIVLAHGGRDRFADYGPRISGACVSHQARARTSLQGS
jgi:hypothetical protein